MTPKRGAIAAFAVVAIGGYALLRLYGAIGEPDPRTVGPTAHTAYYWRMATATWWASLAALGALRAPRVGEACGRALPWVVLAAALAAVIKP